MRFNPIKGRCRFFSTISLFNGGYSFVTPIERPKMYDTFKEDQFADYFIDKYEGKRKSDEHFIYDNFIKDSNYIAQKYTYPYSIKDTELKAIRNYPFQEQIKFFISFLRTSQEALTVNEQFIKDFRMYFLMSKHEKLAEMFTDPFLDLRFRAQEFGPFNYRYKRSYIHLLKLIDNLYPISLYNLVYFFCKYNMISLLKETTEDKEVTYFIEASLKSFVKKLNLSNHHESMTLMRFVNLMDDRFADKVQGNNNYKELLNILDNYYLNISSVEAVKGLIEGESYPEALFLAHMIKSAHVLYKNGFTNGAKMLKILMDILNYIDYDRVSPINLKELMATILLLNPAQVDRDVVSRILLSEQIIAFNTLEKEFRRLCMVLCDKFGVNPYPIDMLAKIDSGIPVLYQRTDLDETIDNLHQSFIYGKKYLEGISRSAYFGRAFVLYILSVYNTLYKNLYKELNQKEAINNTTIIKALQIKRDLLKYVGVPEKTALIKRFLDVLNPNILSKLSMPVHKEIIALMEEYSNEVRNNPCYMSQFLNRIKAAIIYGRESNKNIDVSMALFDKFCIGYMELLTEKITNFSELKIFLNFLLMNLQNNRNEINEKVVSSIIDKSQLAIEHMKNKNKASLNFIILNIKLLNAAMERYPGIFNNSSNEQLRNNLDFCIKTVIENESVDLATKAELFNNTHNLYSNLLNKSNCKYLFETMVLQPLLRMVESTISENKLDNITQCNFFIGKHQMYSNCTNIIELIDIFEIKLSEPQLKSIFNIYERAIPYVQPSSILTSLERLTKYDQAKDCVLLLLEHLFSRHQIHSSISEDDHMILNVFYNTDKTIIDIEKLLEYMITHDIRLKGTKTALGLAFYIYEQLSSKQISISVLSKFYRQLDDLHDLNLRFLNVAVRDYLSTVGVSNLKFFDIVYLPFEFLPEKYHEIVISGEHFDVSHWSPRSLNLLIEYMSRNNLYVQSFISVLIANIKTLISSDINFASLSKLTVSQKYIDSYLGLMKALINENKLTKHEITDVLFTYFVNKDYYDINSNAEKVLFDDFFTNLADTIIVKEDLFGLIIYNPELQAFGYPSFEKVMGLTVTDPGVTDTIKGNFDNPTEYDVNVNESVSLKGEFLLYDRLYIDSELYKRYYFWRKLNDSFMATYKFPLEYNNIHYKKFELYHVNAFKTLPKFIKILNKLRSTNLEKICLKIYSNAEKSYTFVPVELKHNIANSDGVQKEITNVCKFLAINTKANNDKEIDLSVISIDEIENDPKLFESLKLLTTKEQAEDEEIEEATKEEPDVIASAIDKEKGGIIEV